MLPALYEVRNNRSVGHTGGDVDPNHMDSVLVLSMCSWVMGELVRVYHGLNTSEAQAVVEALAEIRIPVIWAKGNLKRVLNPKLRLPEQIRLLTATTVPSTDVQSLLEWTEAKNQKHFMKTLRALHKNRLVEYDAKSGTVEILPPGTIRVQQLIRDKKLAGI